MELQIGKQYILKCSDVFDAALVMTRTPVTLIKEEFDDYEWQCDQYVFETKSGQRQYYPVMEKLEPSHYLRKDPLTREYDEMFEAVL